MAQRILTPSPAIERRRAVILGAGIAGRLVLEELKRHKRLGYHPVGFLDDDPRKRRRMISGLPVFGGLSDLAAVARAHRIRLALLAIPSASGELSRKAARLSQQAGVELRVVPGFYEVLQRDTAAGRLRPVTVEDFFRRAPVPFDVDAIRTSLTGKAILITGAAGSIGQELCRQLAAIEPRQLLLFDHEENNLYETYLGLREQFPSLTMQLLVGDIRDRARVRSVLRSHRPDVLYHAAAYKHVPIMEFNLLEAIKTNILGTAVLAEEASAAGVGRFVLISTDKAVRPSCVMGACKRFAELVVLGAHRRLKAGRGRLPTALMAVRFGNVMASRGNVIERFTRQIEAGGPVTITHPSMKRFFMTREEASQLVMQASAFGRGGELFVLDMGSQVKIGDLAKEMIRLAGFKPGVDIEIVTTGVRPGEKMQEELLTKDERAASTRHKRIRVIPSAKAPNWNAVSAALRAFAAAVKAEDDARGRALLHHYVPDYEEPGHGRTPRRRRG